MITVSKVGRALNAAKRSEMLTIKDRMALEQVASSPKALQLLTRRLKTFIEEDEE